MRTLLADEVLPAGDHEVTWSGRDQAGRPLPSGLDLARLALPGGEDSRKLVLLK